MAISPDQLSYVLPNGLKVILVQHPFGKGFSACLSFRAGSQDDPPDAIGVAHLTEHLAFIGEAKSISRELSQNSVYVNAVTEPQRTTFYASGHSDFLPKSLRLLASVLQPAVVEEKACVHERQIVKREMEDNYPKSPKPRSDNLGKFSRRLAGDPTWRFDETEYRTSIKSLTSDAVNQFRKSHYYPGNAAMAIAAPLGFDQFRCLVEEVFALVDSPQRSQNSHYEKTDWQATPPVNFHFDRWPITWVVLVNTAGDSNVATRLSADVLTHELGGGCHSEMYRRFREETAEAYRASTMFRCWTTHTSVESFVSVNKKSALDAVNFLIERGQRFADEGIDAKQRDWLMERTRQWWEMRMENSFALVDFLSSEALLPDGLSMADLRPDWEVLEAITEEQLSVAARRIFDPKNRKLFVGGRIGWLGRWKIRQLLDID